MLESVSLSSIRSPSKYFLDKEVDVCPREDVFPCSSVVLREGLMGSLSGKALKGSNSDDAEVEGGEAVDGEGEGFQVRGYKSSGFTGT